MARKIKFRGRQISNGAWAYGYIYQAQGRWFIHVADEKKSYDCYEIDPKTVGEYIGRQDIKTKEIYEDDIVISEYDDRKRVVEWCEEEACYKMRHLQNESWCENLFFNDVDEIEVIGSIHTIVMI